MTEPQDARQNGVIARLDETMKRLDKLEARFDVHIQTIQNNMAEIRATMNQVSIEVPLQKGKLVVYLSLASIIGGGILMLAQTLLSHLGK